VSTRPLWGGELNGDIVSAVRRGGTYPCWVSNSFFRSAEDAFAMLDGLCEGTNGKRPRDGGKTTLTDKMALRASGSQAALQFFLDKESAEEGVATCERAKTGKAAPYTSLPHDVGGGAAVLPHDRVAHSLSGR
jgi:hypothetical protein